MIGHDIVPKVEYSHGDMSTGFKLTIMEDLSDYVDSGVLFGPGNPMNWKRDLVALSKRAGDPVPSAAQVMSVTFKSFAQLHSKFWRNKSLIDGHHGWLRGADWVVGRGESEWIASQNYARERWASAKAGNGNAINWDPNVFDAIEKAVASISWPLQLKRLNVDGHWTLVQGDCWPGNVMWHRDAHVKLIDFEMVGVGSGPQDLGQYVIANMIPSERRACEHRILREYFDELTKVVDNFSFEQCWEEYVIGGAERWCWFVAYIAGGTDVPGGQFFHDQLSAFMRDHKLTAEKLTQVRP
jgi:hypothetical protein